MTALGRNRVVRPVRVTTGATERIGRSLRAVVGQPNRPGSRLDAAFLRRAIETAPDAIVVVDPVTRHAEMAQPVDEAFGVGTGESEEHDAEPDHRLRGDPTHQPEIDEADAVGGLDEHVAGVGSAWKKPCSKTIVRHAAAKRRATAGRSIPAASSAARSSILQPRTHSSVMTVAHECEAST